jgi:hypothetical protein
MLLPIVRLCRAASEFVLGKIAVTGEHKSFIFRGIFIPKLSRLSVELACTVGGKLVDCNTADRDLVLVYLLTCLVRPADSAS